MFEFFKYRRQFYPLERCLLLEVINCAPSGYKDRLRKQIESITIIQRLSGLKEIDFYPMKNGKAYHDQRYLLPFRKSDHVVCTIDFEIKDSNSRFKMKAWLIEGFLFMLTFDKSPKQYRMCDEIVITKILPSYSDLTVQPINNAMGNETVDTQKLKELLGDYNFEFMFRPIPETKKEELLCSFDSKLPKDYIKLISYADGFEIGCWIVHGLTKIRHVVGKDFNYYILAETSDGYLTVKEGSDNAQLSFFMHDQDAVNMGSSFISALKQVLDEN